MRGTRSAFPWALVAAVVWPGASPAQEPPPPAAAALRVFLDCGFCDDDHFRREAPFLDYVRDRADAEVHVLGTSQATGAGREYTFHFIGLARYAGRDDTLVYRSSSTDTRDETRDGQVRTFLVGVLRYAVETPAMAGVTVSYRPPAGGPPAAQPEDDPWDFWVFTVGGGGSLFKESRQRRYSVNGDLSANRITEAWKVELFAFGSWDRSESDLTDSTFVDTRRSWLVDVKVIRSLGDDHWAAGLEAVGDASTFSNQDLGLRAGAAVEYSLFPYAQSTRRQATVLYAVGVNYFSYEEVTIFDRTAETRLRQTLEIAAAAVQPWGRASASLEGQTFLHDLSLHRIEGRANLNLRLFRGLRFNLNGSAARIKDQIFLPREDLSDEDILIQRRQLGTAFRVRVRLGFNYTFGSIFNNVVNPRMDEF